jgi:catechol 2,3-dioxygenase-like lactoylglutathione lyase family enzyme
MGIRLNQVNFVCADVAATSDFYRRLGMRVDEGPPEWADRHITARQDDGADIDFDSVSFASEWDEGWPGGPGTVVGFSVDSREEVDRVVADMAAAGYRVQQPPYDAMWGARYAVVEDPDGRPVGVMSPIPSRA